MTVSQSAQLDTFDFGSSLGTVTLHDPETDDLVANGTAASSDELSVDSGTYLIVWTGVDASALIPAGVYRVRTAVGGSPLKRFVTLTGVDGELVYARSERAVELDSAVTLQLQSIEDGVDANTGYLTSVLARIGSFTGTGVNNVLGFLRAMFRSDASTPSDVGGTATSAAHSQQAIRVRGDEAWVTESGSSSGARTVTVTVNDGTTVLENVTVRMTEGVNTYVSTTNVSGVATFNLDDATYTVSISKPGYSYSGTTLIVDETETVTYSMTAISITPGTGSFTTGLVTAYDQNGAVEVGVIVYSELVTLPSGNQGFTYDTKVKETTSDINGLVQITGLVKGATYRFWRGQRIDSRHLIPAAAGSTYELPSIIGREQ